MNLDRNKTLAFASLVSNIFRFLEYCLISALVIFLTWLFYSQFCNTQSCNLNSPTQENIKLFIQSFFLAFGFSNSIRLASVFLINDPDEDPEDRYYLSLMGLTICYSLIGFFFENFSQIALRTSRESPIFIFTLFTFALTVISILSERGIWDKFTIFLKFRVSYSLLNIILLIFNPGFGIILSILFLPVIVFWPEKNNL
jgi:hypothetical protein